MPAVVRPQVWRKPASRLLNECPPATAEGVRGSSSVPFPIAPTSFSPQQYAVPLPVTPQVCPMNPPAMIWAKTIPPLTGTGENLEAVVPSPSAPKALAPQQNALPALVRPQVWLPSPADRDANTTVPETGAGAEWAAWSWAPMPSWPPPLWPQQYAWPAWVSPQVYPRSNPPAVICWNTSPPVTATGPARSVVLPSPTCPRLLDPQQY